MKIQTVALAIALFFSVIATSAQSPNKTIVLVRHSEKDVSAEASKTDPDLSAEGRARALRLRDILKQYKPHEIFSTNFKRTKQTAEPIAAARGKQIQTYNPTEHADLVKRIMASSTDHNLIFGHSNTVPTLVNMFAGKTVFRDLPESEYGVYYVMRFKNAKLVKIEVFPY